MNNITKRSFVLLVKYMDEVSPFTLYVVSCTAGFLSAMAVLGKELLLIPACSCRITVLCPSHDPL